MNLASTQKQNRWQNTTTSS